MRGWIRLQPSAGVPRQDQIRFRWSAASHSSRSRSSPSGMAAIECLCDKVAKVWMPHVAWTLAVGPPNSPTVPPPSRQHAQQATPGKHGMTAGRRRRKVTSSFATCMSSCIVMQAHTAALMVGLAAIRMRTRWMGGNCRWRLHSSDPQGKSTHQHEQGRVQTDDQQAHPQDDAASLPLRLPTHRRTPSPPQVKPSW